MSVQPDASGQQKVTARRDAFTAGRDLNVTIAAPDPGEPVTPGLLPRDVPGFTGRSEELARLAGLAGGGRVVVTAIGGTAGVGKTALAVHAAHQLLAEFPDGHLYADLRGYTEGQDPVEPGEALELFLRSLGVKAGDIPSGVTERSGLLRQLLGSLRLVMVLDNARTEAQVRPLLPGAGTSLVLVTSRSTLPGLETDERISLDVLSQDEAVTMLAGLGGHRAAADPTAVAEVARLCGRLPLALRIAGQLLATHPTWPVVWLAQLLTGERDRLARLGAGDLQVRAAFEVSYQQLSDQDARLLRLIGLHPGPDFTPAAAAALAGADEEAAESALARLAAANLVAEDTVGRFTLHDLLRLFARAACEQADPLDQRTAAEKRLVRHYENLAAFLDSCVDPELRAKAEQEGKLLSSMRQALAVFEAERPSLLAALAVATERGWDEERRELCASMGYSLMILRYPDDLLMVRETALAAARRAGDANAEAHALNGVGLAYADLRRFEEAIARYQEALVIFRETGDQLGEGQVLNNLGTADRQFRRFEEAIASYQQALAIFRETGDRRGEARVLANLGSADRQLRRFEEAIDSHRQALVIFRETGDQISEGWTLANLGNVYRGLRRFEESITSFQQALVISREIGDRSGEGHALNNLGNVYVDLQRSADAVASYQEALTIKREVGDRYEEGTTLKNLGIAYAELRRFAEAMASYQAALLIFREVGDRQHEGLTLSHLGHAYQEIRQPEQAAAYCREAAAALRAAGHHEQAAGLELLAANTAAQRRHWWRRPWRSPKAT
jgi:tetratricopeptide (TPR) repeat protein